MRSYAIVGLLVVVGCGYNPHRDYPDLPDASGQTVLDAALAAPDSPSKMDAGGAGGSGGSGKGSTGGATSTTGGMTSAGGTTSTAGATATMLQDASTRDTEESRKPDAKPDGSGDVRILSADAKAATSDALDSGDLAAPAVVTITGGPDLGTVALGEKGSPVTFTVRNIGGTDATGVVVTSNNAAFVLGNDGCTGQTLAKTTGACTVTLTFAPSATGLPGAYNGLLTASSDGGNPFNLPITATATRPAVLTIAPNPLAFGGIPLNTQSPDGVLTITNTGGVTTGALTVPSALGNGFAISRNTCSAPLLPSQGCTMAVTYTPESVAWASFSFTVTSASGAAVTEFLTGTGKQPTPPNVLDITPRNVKGCGELSAAAHSTSGSGSTAVQCFADTTVGQADGSLPGIPVSATAPVTFIITNELTASDGGISLESGLVTVTIGGANASDFAKASTTCGPSLQPGQTCICIISFKPTASGLRTATIIVTSANGGNVGTNIEGIGLGLDAGTDVMPDASAATPDAPADASPPAGDAHPDVVALQGVFVPTGSMTAARMYHTATLLPGGQVLIAGGDGPGGYLASAELYDPATGRFALTGNMTMARETHTATPLPNGIVLIAGGGSSSGYLPSAELYDPATGTFTVTGSLSAARGSHTATLLGNGKVLIAGGYNDSGGYLASAELYDPGAGTFTATGSMTVGRNGHTATLLPNGEVLIAAGEDNSGVLASAELYDPATGVFAVTGSLTTARDSHTATLLGNGLVLIAGGNGVLGYLARAELYDATAGTFTVTGNMTVARSPHTAALLGSGKVLITGGTDDNLVALTSAELYNPNPAGTFTVTGSMTVGRVFPTATLLPNGHVLVAGGQAVSDAGSWGTLASAELYE